MRNASGKCGAQRGADAKLRIHDASGRNLYALANGMPAFDSRRVFAHAGAVLLGDIAVGDLTSIWPCATVRADSGGRVRIGSYSNIQEHAGIHSGDAEFPVTIGDHSTIAHGAIVHGATIGDFVCIGMGAVVLNGARIPDFVLIGANAVVPEGSQLESGMLYVGTPAKPIRVLSDQQRTWLVLNAAKYVALTRQSLGIPASASQAVFCNA